MRNPYELFTGLRYTRAKRRNHFISFISLTSMICIALGVATLIVVLSVMNGFEGEMRTRILGMIAHATISSPDGIEDWQSLAALAAKNPKVEATAPYVEGQAMVRMGGAVAGVMLRGVDPAQEGKVSEVAQYMKAGKFSDLTPGAFNIVIGAELAEQFGVGVGDKIDVMIPQVTITPAGVLPRYRRFTVVGVFQVGHYEYDSGLVEINLRDASALYRMDGRVTGVRLKLYDMYQAHQVAQEIAAQLPQQLQVSDWFEQNANYFHAVATEKVVMFLILSLLVGLAAINIVSMLVMVVQEKQSDIAILRTLGSSPRSIMAIFMVQGSIIGVIGTVAGVALGVAVALHVTTLVPLLQAATGHQFLDPSIYYISDLPSDLETHDVIRISALSLALGLLSTLYPAFRASRVQPAEALRYE
jgi:lipoprotein-releasing system permease protein